MKCPHCGEDLPGVACPECGEISPEGANFCSACGHALVSGKEYAEDSEDAGETDFDDRVLCPDGTCTGIIVDGKCTECGKSVGKA